MPEGGRSAFKQSRVLDRISFDTGCVDSTPSVDCTVSAVMHAVPNNPCAAKTIRSAVTPAPDEGSKPAMVRTVFMGAGSENLLFFEKSYLFANRTDLRLNLACSGLKGSFWVYFRVPALSIFYITKRTICASLSIL